MGKKNSIFLIAVFLLSFGSTVYGHVYYQLDERYGWTSFPSGSHWVTGSLLYNYTTNVSSNLKTITDNAAYSWDEDVPDLMMYEAPLPTWANGTIDTFYNSSSNTVANGGFDYTDNHGESWNVNYNTYYMPYTNNNYNQRVAVHEIGHAIGLDHITYKCNNELGCNNSFGIDNSSNALYEANDWKNAVDYWTNKGNTYPGSGDITGAKDLNNWF